MAWYGLQVRHNGLPCLHLALPLLLCDAAMLCTAKLYAHHACISFHQVQSAEHEILQMLLIIQDLGLLHLAVSDDGSAICTSYPSHKLILTQHPAVLDRVLSSILPAL